MPTTRPPQLSTSGQMKRWVVLGAIAITAVQAVEYIGTQGDHPCVCYNANDGNAFGGGSVKTCNYPLARSTAQQVYNVQDFLCGAPEAPEYSSVCCDTCNDWGCADLKKDSAKSGGSSNAESVPGEASSYSGPSASATSSPESSKTSQPTPASASPSVFTPSSSEKIAAPSSSTDSPDSPDPPDSPDSLDTPDTLDLPSYKAVSKAPDLSKTPYVPSSAATSPSSARLSSARTSSTPSTLTSSSPPSAKPTVSTTSSRLKTVSSVPPKPAADASEPNVPAEPAEAQASPGIPPPGVSSSPLGPPDFSINSTYSPTAGAQATEQVLALPETIVQDGTTFTLDKAAVSNGGESLKPWEQDLSAAGGLAVAHVSRIGVLVLASMISAAFVVA